MESRDHKTTYVCKSGREVSSDTVDWSELRVNPREKAHIVRALKVLHGEIEKRDQISGRGSGDYSYPPGSEASLVTGRPQDPPLYKEIGAMIAKMESPTVYIDWIGEETNQLYESRPEDELFEEVQLRDLAAGL